MHASTSVSGGASLDVVSAGLTWVSGSEVSVSSVVSEFVESVDCTSAKNQSACGVEVPCGSRSV